MNGSLKAYLQLIRAPGVFSILSNILASVFILISLQDIHIEPVALLGLILISLFCYQVGMIVNDVADINEDKQDRPFRPLPSDRITKRFAITVAIFLSVGAICVASLFSGALLFLVLTMLLVIFSYNFLTKNTLCGPINMGLVRYLNWLLVLGLFSLLDKALLLTGTIIFLYTTLVTIVSRYEIGDFPPSVKYILSFIVLAIIAVVGLLIVTSRLDIINSLPLFIFLIWLLWKIYSFSPLSSFETQGWVTTLLKHMVVLDGLLLICFAQYVIGLLCISFLFFSSKLAKKVYLT